MHSVRYAHCEGHTDVCFADDASGRFCTTGEDGDVRVWQGYDDLDATSFRAGDKCFALAYKANRLYVADEMNELKRYDATTHELLGVVTSFTLPVTCMAVNSAHTMLACGAADFEIHLVELATLRVSTFATHEGPVLSICFDPLEKYFLSTACDATARFWSVQNLNNVKTVANLFPKSNDFNDSVSRGRAAWHKDAGLIALPCHKDIQFYERESWIQKFKITLSGGENGEDFCASILCFSPDGKYVLATTSTQMVYVHSIVNKSLVFKYSYTKKSKICSLVWNPVNQNEIIFCDIKGNMGQIKPAIKDDIDSSYSSSNHTTQETQATKKKLGGTSKSNENLEMNDLLDLIDTDNEKSNDSADSNNSKAKKSAAKKTAVDTKSPSKKRKRLNEEEEKKRKQAESHEDDEESNEAASVDIDEDDDEEEDLESIEKLKARAFKSVKKEIMAMEHDNDDDSNDTEVSKKKDSSSSAAAAATAAAKLPAVLTQQAFQPGSTPLFLSERYMAWNSVGVITQFNREEDDSIEIEFHNASYHHTIHLKNQYGYTMADMSREVVVLASPGAKSLDEEERDELNPVLSSSLTSHSKLACILLNSLDNSKEWTVEMPRKEYVRCVCASRTLVACATSRRFLRIYHLAGTQREIISLPGAALCLAAYDNCVFVVYVRAAGVGYSIYYLDEGYMRRQAEHGELTLSGGDDAHTRLEWMGFSDEGNPYYYDSQGFLFAKALTVSARGVWSPFSNLRASLVHKSDHYWLVGVAERSGLVKTVHCKTAKYPNVLPRPTMTMMPIAMPFTDVDTEKTQLEQEYWKNKHFVMSMKNYDCLSGNLEMDQYDVEEKIDALELNARGVLMKLFISACKNSREQRAYEIASIMEADALQLAIKYATKTRALNLAQHLNVLAERKAERKAAELEYAQAHMNEYAAGDATGDNSKNYSCFNNTANNNNNNTVESIRPNVIEDTQNEMVVERTGGTAKSIFATNTPKLSDTTNSQLTGECDSSYKTPVLTPLAATSRLNPFAKNNLSAKISQTPTGSDNNTPKSVINKIEEKIMQQSASKEAAAAAKADPWKPISNKKSALIKQK